MAEERHSSAAMSETPKKTCNGTLKYCRCCNSSLAKIFDSICLFGKTAQKAENLLEHLKEIGGIEVLEEDVDVLSTKVCRKCFRKIVGLGKAVHAFREMCLKSKQIQNEMYMNARQKRGRNPSSPQAKNNPEKRIRQCVSSQFTVRHFDDTPTDTESRRSVALRVRASLFPSEDQTLLGEILPLPVSEEATIRETAETLQASEILQDAGLRNSEVGFVLYFCQLQVSFKKKNPLKLFFQFRLNTLIYTYLLITILMPQFVR